MSRRVGAFALVFRSLVFGNLLLGSLAWGQDIHFKSRTFRGAANEGIAVAGADAASAHQVVQFDHPPGTADLDGLARDGLTVVASLPDNAVVVHAPGGVVPPGEGRRWAGGIEVTDKLSALLPNPAVDGSDPDGQVLAIVEFHGDVTGDQQDTVGGAEGITLQRGAPLRGNHAVVSMTRVALESLAAHDEVAYVFPGDPGLLSDPGVMTCAGMLTATGPVGQYANIVHGWDLDADHVAHLGYFFGSITPKVPAATAQAEVVRALNEWARQTNVAFAPAASLYTPRSVVVKFVSGAHGDSYPFDGAGGVLAHTFYPVPINAESIAGDIHLDADENWHAGADVDIYSVALHEAGHAIGLGHSDKPGDVMYPYYRSHMSLSANDIGAAQTLYGVAQGGSAGSGGSGSGGSGSGGSAGSGGAIPVSTPKTTTLKLQLDSVAATTQNSPISLSGTLSGGQAPWSVQWQTDQGHTGKAAMLSSGTGGLQAWTSTAIPLVPGSNTVTVTAFDGTRQAATATVGITLTPAQSGPGTGGIPVSILVTTPAGTVSSVNGSTLSLAGTAAGAAGISKVTWQTAAGAAGTAAGTEQWRVAAVPLLVGTNTVIVRAWDAKGSMAWASIVVVRH